MIKIRTGSHHTEETKEKMRIANSGKNHPMYGKHLSEKTKEKIRIAHLGKLHTEETKKKMRLNHADVSGENHPNYGKCLPEETRKKLRLNHANFSGENNPSWKGGISYLPYCYKFNNRFKEKIRDKFNRKCFICGRAEKENGRKLNVHHVNYNKDCLCDDSKCYFVPLCNACHARTNQNREFWEMFLTKCCEELEKKKEVVI